uniref:Uncharacterized protein n=1 Tax=Arundo donax TaxID=35708 RepID=A0A0A9CK30_ARUDO
MNCKKEQATSYC